MGSPLALVLANFFMDFYESKSLNEYKFKKPKFYLRYVDDILAAFEKEQDSTIFLKFLNNKHPNIKGTISGLRQFLATESPLKTMKNAFYFTSKALFVLKIFKFLTCLFGHVPKRLD